MLVCSLAIAFQGGSFGSTTTRSAAGAAPVPAIDMRTKAAAVAIRTAVRAGSMSRSGQPLGDEAINPAQPLVANGIALKERIVFRLGQFDKRAVRQQSGGAALRRRRDDDLALRRAEQDRRTDRGEKLRFLDPRDQSERAVEPTIGRL